MYFVARSRRQAVLSIEDQESVHGIHDVEGESGVEESDEVSPQKSVGESKYHGIMEREEADLDDLNEKMLTEEDDECGTFVQNARGDSLKDKVIFENSIVGIDETTFFRKSEMEPSAAVTEIVESRTR